MLIDLLILVLGNFVFELIIIVHTEYLSYLTSSITVVTVEGLEAADLQKPTHIFYKKPVYKKQYLETPKPKKQVLESLQC